MIKSLKHREEIKMVNLEKEKEMQRMNEEFAKKNPQNDNNCRFWVFLWTIIFGIFGLIGYLLYLSAYDSNKENFKESAIVGGLTLIASIFIWGVIYRI